MTEPFLQPHDKISLCQNIQMKFIIIRIALLLVVPIVCFYKEKIQGISLKP